VLLLEQQPSFKHQKPLLLGRRIALELRIAARVNSACSLSFADRCLELRE
jgi:hypothetical protein